MSEKLSYRMENGDNPWKEIELPPKQFTGETAPSEIEVRELNKWDDMRQVAGLVYEVDPYICPDFFGDKERAEEIGSVLFKDDGGLFDYGHTLVAEEDGELHGILIFADNTITPWDCAARKAEIEASGIEMPEYFDRANEQYMRLVVEDARTLPDGVAEIEWVATDPNHRGKGIATKLLDRIKADPRYHELHLTVLADNPPAVRAYEKAGFEIVSTQTGYPDDAVPTHNMVWRRPE
ncbi:GNAT family N-acetyltransferase [Candidatus Saccharibacteria bacterium]|nr:GNAT family N-acetyltransferase [Candidatus Saccharibacteria bacterium]